MVNPKNIVKATKPQKSNFFSSLVKLLKFAKGYYLPLIFAVVFSVAGVVLELIGPNALSDITNLIEEGLMTGIDINAVTGIAIFLVIIYVSMAILYLLDGIIIAHVTQKISQGLRTKISNKINKLSLKTIDGSAKGDILSRITNDVDTIGQALNNCTSSLISYVVLFLGSIIMMFVHNWIMALSAIVSSLIGFVLVAVILSKSQKHFRQRQERLGVLNGHIEEAYSGHDSITVCNAKEQEYNKFNKLNKDLYSSDFKSQFLSGLMHPLMAFVGNLGFVVVCVVGALLVSNNIIEIGTIVAFMLYVRYFTQPLTQIAQAMTSLQSASAASNRVFEFLSNEELSDESHKTKKLTDVKGEVEFKHVKFGYDPNKIIIKDFSAKIPAGSKVAIVGPTGAGKTTIVNLLMRFYDIQDGDITIDGVSINDLTRENVHDIFSMVLQDTWIFEGTIEENLVFNKTGITHEMVEKACKECGIHSFIKAQPNGYDTVLNEDSSISSGQKQLLTIARAMLQDTPLLILDEATSNVDTRTELQIQKAMDKLSENRTSFVIAHRLSTIKNSDIILVLKDGNIIETGNHEELLKKNGFYAELYKSQFEEK